MEAKIVQKSPFPVDVESGKTYYYCTCGLSENQPFCNGSHKGTGFSPLKFEAKESKKVYFCGCKNSSNNGLCDGTHSSL